MNKIWYALFVCSGFAAILYEVVFNKYVSYVFGSTAYAASTVLAAYMGGLSLGSWLGGRLAARLKRPLLWYGVLELAAASYFYEAGAILDKLGVLQRPLYGHGSVVLLTAYQFVSSFAVVLLPTMFLGATFPLVIHGLFEKRKYGELVSLLYLSNTLGTAAGTLISAYRLLPELGLRATLAVGVKVAAGLLVTVALLQLWPRRRAAALEPAPVSEAEAPLEDLRGLSYRDILALAFFSGFTVFGYEVVWTHLYALLLGNSVYSFAVVLFSVLLGMVIGSALVHRGRGRLVEVVIGSQLLLFGAAFALTQLIDYIPDVFNVFGPLSLSFGAREVVKVLVTTSTLLLPCACLGVMFPALIVLAQPAAERAGRDVGRLYSINTLAAVLGSLTTGFVVLPLLGSKGSLVLLVAANGAVAVFLLRRAGGVAWNRRRAVWIAAALALTTTALHPAWSWRRLLQATGVYFSAMPTSTFARVLENKEDVHGGVTTVVESPDGVHYLLSNGKFQGDDGPEVVDQYSFALLTEVHPHGHARALNIGVGVGGTLGVLSLLPYQHVDGVEIAPPIVESARRWFDGVSFGAFHSPRVSLHLLDGRHYLTLLPEGDKYDVITVQVTSIWFAGAANLYSREFYQLVASRLQPDGVVQQWVQLHHMRFDDLLVVLKTLRTQFKYVELFVPGHQGILLASNRPLELDAQYLSSLPMPKPLADKELDFEDLAGSILLDAREVDALLAAEAGAQPISTNDFPFLEFATPKGNALGFNFSDNVSRLLSSRVRAEEAHLHVGDGTPPDVAERLRFKFRVRELKLYRPYSLAWLEVLNRIAAMPLHDETRASLDAMLQKWSAK
jgi:spermidine synthase